MSYDGEDIERAALESLHAAAGPAMTRQLGLASIKFGSAFASLAGALPASAIIINRTLGLGLHDPAPPKKQGG